MLRRLLRYLAPALLVLALSSTTVQAQPPANAETEKSEKSTSALPYFVLTIYTLLVMTIVCMPSRKA
jgi:hypothetical protein